jgi:SAM-dependent methyltransferase
MTIRKQARAAAGRARRYLRGKLTPPPPTFATAVPRPVPEGWSEAELRRLMESLSIDDARPEALAGYVHEAFWRFLHTWGCVRDDEGPALELGANPYFLTYLLQTFTDLDMTLANFFGAEHGTLVQEVRWRNHDGSEHTEKMRSDLFNMEEDRFPYPDNAFEVVLFCEILEHLLMNPLHALGEIRRVLRPTGKLVLTTPNVARLDNVLSLVASENVYDPYSGFGPYGRHNREYTMHDVARLLRFAGFEIEHQFTADSCRPATPYAERPGYAAVAPELGFRQNDLGQYLFVVARPVRPPRAGLPDFLYRSYPADQIVAGG